MAQEIIGLVGKGKGPRLTIPGHAKAMFAIAKGLCANFPVSVHVEHNSGLSTHTMLADGRIELPIGSTVQFEYAGKNTVFCSVRVV